MSHTLLPWVAFNAFLLAMLALDLGVFHRRAHVVRVGEALVWTAVWIFLALLFNAGLYVWQGPRPALEFFTGYLLEKSLSVDNIFVFLVIFTYFQVPARLQHKVLYWGIVSALVMRGAFIAAGVTLIHRFEWIVYLFGAFLIFTGVKMAYPEHRQVEPERNPVLRAIRRLVPLTESYEDGGFFVRRGARYLATPLLVVLAVVETTDLVFAFDSIPAILAITYDPFIVYTSNAFAILGLRALYFALAGIIDLFHYLHLGLALILIFVGVKMLLAHLYPIPVEAALAVVAGILAVTVVTSLLWPPPERRRAPGPPAAGRPRRPAPR